MICRKCGELLSDSARVCPVCGAHQRTAGGTKLNPGHTDAEDCAHEERPRKKRSGTQLQDLAGLLILIGAVALIGSVPVLLTDISVHPGSPRIPVLFGVAFAALILVCIGFNLYKRK